MGGLALPMVGWLPLLAAGTLAFAVFTYVVLDGTDLGVGILFAVDRRDEDREVMVDTILPVWDGNETWLVLGGGGLIGMFPLAYSALLTALYPVIIAMLMALIFRGMTIEYRARASEAARARFWDKAMLGGSVLPGFCQGVILGAFIHGIRTKDGAYVGGWWDWLTPFSVLCGVALVTGYALLGACWLVWRTEGELQRRSRRHARVLALATLAFIVIVSIWTPMLNAAYRQRWFAWPNILLLSPVPILLALCALWFWRSLSKGREIAPLVAALACFLLCYAGFGVSVYPNIVPPSLSIPAAASARSSQIFALVGSAILIPAILAYSTYSFSVFRGKVRPKGSGVQKSQGVLADALMLPEAAGRIFLRSSEEVVRQISEDTQRSVAYFGRNPGEIGRRLEELDREWDVDRALEVNAVAVAFTGTFLGTKRNRAFLILPAVVTIFLVQRALVGWCPPLPILRRLGFRTAGEIDCERDALKTLRGDFHPMPDETS